MITRAQRRRGSSRGVGQLLGIARRSEALVGLTIGLMLAVVASVIALAPRALGAAESSSLENAISDAPQDRRHLAVRVLESFRARIADDPIAEELAVVERAAEIVPASVSSSYGEPRIVIDSPRFVVASVNSTPTASPTTLTMRVHPEIEEHSRVVAGRAARPEVERVDDLQVIEFELSTTAAEMLGLELGDVLELEVDTTDVATRRFNGGLPAVFAARLVGLRELDPVEDPYWFGQASLHRPVVMDTGVGADYVVFGSMPMEALPIRPFVVDGRGPLLVEQRREFIATGISIADADELLTGLHALTASASASATPGRPAIVAGLGEVLEAERSQRAAARSSVVLAAVGVLGVALVTLVLCLQVALHRRREWLAVAVARGASARQVLIAGTVEVAVISGVAVMLGWLVARAFAAGPINAGAGGVGSPTTAPLLVLWIGSVVTAALMLITIVRRPIEASGRRSGRRRTIGMPVRVGAMLLVVLTAGAAIIFRRRGVSPDGDSIDTMAVLLPVMLPLCAGLVAAQVLPVLLGPIARRGLHLGPGRIIGIRRSMIRPGAGTGLVVVLTLALTVAGLGLGISRSLERSITDASRTEVSVSNRTTTRDADLVDDHALELEDRAAISERENDDPLVQIVRRSYVAAGVVEILLALLAVAAIAVLTARQRQRDIGLLGLLGAGHEEARRAVGFELLPPCAVGIVLGTLIGRWMANAFDGRFDLSPFASGADVPLRPDTITQLIVAVAVAGAVWSMLAVLQRRSVRAPSSEVLRAQEAG
jgi:putative ABC transport system permease protein